MTEPRVGQRCRMEEFRDVEKTDVIRWEENSFRPTSRRVLPTDKKRNSPHVKKCVTVECVDWAAPRWEDCYRRMWKKSFSSKLNRTDIAYIYRSSVFTALYVNGFYEHNSDRLWVTKILRSAKYEVWSCLNIRGTFVNGYWSKRLQFINAPPSLSTDAGQTSVWAETTKTTD